MLFVGKAGIRERFQCESKVIDGALRLEQANGHQWIARLVEAFPAHIQTITLGKPTLEDVFIARTGHRFFGDASGEKDDEGNKTRRKMR